MKQPVLSGEGRKVIAVELGPELAAAVQAECIERTSPVRKCTISDVVREALYTRYFGERQNA